jgi:hypothetical protein
LVSDRAQYRRFARECLEIAEITADPQVRSVLVQMAQVWLRLAQAHAEDNGNNEPPGER